jgi:lipoprotein-anchoring transpeptidase ErfK/SrfK
MRPTWIVLGLVVGIGTVAYVRLRSKADGAALARPSVPAAPASDAARPPVASPAAAEPRPASAPATAPEAGRAPSEAETRAADLRRRIAERLAARDEAAARVLETELEQRFPETDEARRHAWGRGWEAKQAASGRPDAERLPLLDRARRDLSRGLFLPEMFDETGRPNAMRAQAVAAIAEMNAAIYTYKPGLPGVTQTYRVERGDTPVRVVDHGTRQLPYGPNVVLYWNYGRGLDPRRMRAGDVLVLPVEPLTFRVDRSRHLLGIWIGDALVKEHDVGVGRAATPTPVGTFEVKDKYRNPDWHSPTGLIRYGDPKNELGDAWIEISSPEHPKGYGVHGTNRPDTVGSDCSNGCVRLRNEEAVELLGWVRTGRHGPATKIVVR